MNCWYKRRGFRPGEILRERRMQTLSWLPHWSTLWLLRRECHLTARGRQRSRYGSPQMGHHPVIRDKRVKRCDSNIWDGRSPVQLQFSYLPLALCHRSPQALQWTYLRTSLQRPRQGRRRRQCDRGGMPWQRWVKESSSPIERGWKKNKLMSFKERVYTAILSLPMPRQIEPILKCM